MKIDASVEIHLPNNCPFPDEIKESRFFANRDEKFSLSRRSSHYEN